MIRIRTLCTVWLSLSACAALPGQEAPAATSAASEPAPVRVTRAGTRVERTTTEHGRAVVRVVRGSRAVVQQLAPRDWLFARRSRVAGAYETPVRAPYHDAWGNRIYTRYADRSFTPYQSYRYGPRSYVPGCHSPRGWVQSTPHCSYPSHRAPVYLH